MRLLCDPRCALLGACYGPDVCHPVRLAVPPCYAPPGAQPGALCSAPAMCHPKRHPVCPWCMRTWAPWYAGGLQRWTCVHTFGMQVSSGPGRLQYKLPGHAGSVNDCAFHPTQPIIASASSDKTLYLGELMQ